jgi:hypothetical protein
MSLEQKGLIGQIESIVNTDSFYKNSSELDRLMSLLMTLKDIWYTIFYPGSKIMPTINNPMNYKNMEHFNERFFNFYSNVGQLHNLNEYSLQVIDDLIVEIQSMKQYYNKI